MADDSQSLHSVVQFLKAGLFQLEEPAWDRAAELAKQRAKAPWRTQRQTVDEQVASEKRSGLINHLVDGHANRRVVRCDNGAGADAGQNIRPDPVTQELAQDSQVGCPSKTTGAENHTQANLILVPFHNEVFSTSDMLRASSVANAPACKLILGAVKQIEESRIYE